jgi:hypothetical protein
MEPASIPSLDQWSILRLALGLLLLMLPIFAGLAVAAMRAWLRHGAVHRTRGAGHCHKRHRPAEPSLSDWPARRVMVPLPCNRRPRRAHRQ